jgi:hypothetical protein
MLYTHTTWFPAYHEGGMKKAKGASVPVEATTAQLTIPRKE